MRRGGAGNRNQKVVAAANYIKKIRLDTALHPNVFETEPVYLL